MKNYTLVLIILFILLNKTDYAQTNSYLKTSITDDVVYEGLEFENNYYILMSSGLFSTELNFFQMEVTDYDNYLLKFDHDFNVIDSIFFDSINGYNIKYWRSNKIKDTLILVGRALKNDLSDEQISIAKYLLPNLEFIDQQFYGEPDILELVNNFLINHKGNIVVSANNKTNMANRSQIIMEINNNGELLKYINNPDLDVWWSSVYQMPSTLDYIFNNDEKTIVFDSTLTNYNISLKTNQAYRYKGEKCKFNDSTYIIGGNTYTGIPDLQLWVISYYVVNDRSERIDSSFIYLSDTIDKIGGLGFINPSTVIYGGTHNRNWTQQTPEPFEEEVRWIIVKSEDIITKNENWIFKYGGDANYIMRNLLITVNKSCIVSASRYDWESTDIWQRDALIFEIDSTGTIVSTNQEIEIPYVTIYPNPGENSFSFRNNISNCQIKIQDLSGQTVMQKEIQPGFKTVDVSTLSSGFYVISFYEGKQFLFSHKWVKR